MDSFLVSLENTHESEHMAVKYPYHAAGRSCQNFIFAKKVHVKWILDYAYYLACRHIRHHLCIDLSIRIGIASVLIVSNCCLNLDEVVDSRSQNARMDCFLPFV